ncbi:nudix hydrolase 12, mitochondrial-like [Curcuma longa]|uniref:nudix hydrolase 12, mitochondrial-like n=1 Tax=Curcuma longa TaxID=136217 RepID=UPI003D9F1717
MTSPLVARKGRDLQRYEDHLRLVAGCIPYKINEEADIESHDVINNLEVLMISSPGRHDFVFPKGGWEKDETASEAACREALEEAGVRGILQEIELGQWVFRSKSSQVSCSQEGGCKGYMFALKVTEELDYWPEQQVHGRKWVTVADAYKLCRYDWMREALDLLLQRLYSNTVLSVRGLYEPAKFCFVKPTAADQAIALC